MKKAFILLIMIIFVLTFTSCSHIEPVNDDDPHSSAAVPFSKGTWNGSVFTSEWLKISFAVPDNLSAMSTDELKTSLNNSTVVYNDPSSNSVDTNSGVFYDLAIKDNKGVCCLLLIVENTDKTAGGSFISADTYIKSTKSRIEETAVLPYTLSEDSIITIGNNNYISFTASNDYITHTYYIMKYERSFVSWMVTEYAGQQVSPKSVLAAIETL